MTTALLIPVDGTIEVFGYPIEAAAELQKRDAVHLVVLELARDSEPVGRVTYSLSATEENDRATMATYVLTGAWTQIYGLAMVEVDEQVSEDLLRALVMT